jgi:acetyl esterase/lipase
VLRDEGEAYGRKLREAGVDVTATRYEGIIHDFVMLNALRGTNAAGAAIAQAIAYLRSARVGTAVLRALAAVVPDACHRPVAIIKSSPTH